MSYIVQILLNGITQGAVYALMALGYSVIVGVVGLVTFAHGHVIMIGAFSAFYAFQLFGNNILLGLIASFIFPGLLGIVIYKVCYERFMNASRNISLICTIGMSMIISNLAQIIFGPNQKPMIDIIDPKFFHIGPVQISLLQIIIVVTVVVIAILLALFFNKTRYGVGLRAVSQNKVAASLMGINVKRNAMLGNIIGCGLGGVAGLLLSLYYQTLQATMGGPLGMKAFSSSVLGGLTDTRFSALGGLLIGIIENIGIAFTQASFRDIFAFVFMILVLFIRPKGFSSKRGFKV